MSRRKRMGSKSLEIAKKKIGFAYPQATNLKLPESYSQANHALLLTCGLKLAA